MNGVHPLSRLTTTLCVVVACAAATACAPSRDAAFDAAAAAGLTRVDRAAGPFVLALWHRPAPNADTLYVYLEGDGHAWLSRTVPSNDPTPRNPVSLSLAAAERRGPVLYVARPCQFTNTPSCDRRYWTSARFAPEVVDATVAAIRTEQALTGASSVVVTGYSGGGVLAALVAERLETVRALVTVAAPLDLDYWTEHHGISPLSQSLRPLDLKSSRLSAIPQLHVAGGKDSTVPVAVLHSYAQRLGGHCTNIRVEPEFDHQCCWTTRWLLPAPPSCDKDR